MVGNKFGKWTVISRTKKESRSGFYFLCCCECGNEKILPKDHLINGKSTQCLDCLDASRKRYEIEAQVNDWTVLEEKKNHWAEISYLCRCVCGNEKIIRKRDLERDKSKKCRPCATRIKNTTHNYSGSPTYNCWASMKNRCRNSNDGSYKWYGGRGITYCDRWEKFESFLEDMGAKPSGYQLDRLDPDGNYEPNNCKWVTPKQNRENKRCSAKYDGQYITIRKDKLCDSCKDL